MDKPIFLFRRSTIFLSLFLFGCLIGAQQPVVKMPAKKTTFASAVWTHSLQVTQAGTRSAGLQEGLAYDGIPVPPGLVKLMFAGYFWEFRPFVNSWTAWGWHVAGDAGSVAVSGKELTKPELVSGKVVGSWAGRRPGVPDTWVAGTAGRGIWCFDPAKLASPGFSLD